MQNYLTKRLMTNTDVYLAGKSLKDFVMGFQRNQDRASCQKDLGVTGVRLSQELLNELMGLGK